MLLSYFLMEQWNIKKEMIGWSWRLIIINQHQYGHAGWSGRDRRQVSQFLDQTLYISKYILHIYDEETWWKRCFQPCGAKEMASFVCGLKWNFPHGYWCCGKFHCDCLVKQNSFLPKIITLGWSYPKKQYHYYGVRKDGNKSNKFSTISCDKLPTQARLLYQQNWD